MTLVQVAIVGLLGLSEGVGGGKGWARRDLATVLEGALGMLVGGCIGGVGGVTGCVRGDVKGSVGRVCWRVLGVLESG